ncbi:hypothetical protein PFICI_10965 [Pestalotiopsis fici W106-1]|uniref:Heterokaryon incompatibility domain-containing protein n=1 Tax=Pestalotiopsis fici (strain W106-1 / CGMCC3.15140) TaxID=1229662 RepID=W3WW59_PESFW|nr:uncharacterized protein PFICI_10965 [Pestalotiopsis fici W106-1]ETS77091.1 hypothetical protein PFICI_10965 [Pestalotiopsis fici W106-1]
MAHEVIELHQLNRPRATSAKGTYSDLALPPDHIRLLDLHNAPNDAPLTGILRVERLTNLSTYKTLSYQWAKETSQGATIRCSLQTNEPHIELHITTNCAQALQFIRREFGSVTIWVDAICINQDDDKEKENQIPLMGKIYSQAETGFIWLEGDGDQFRDAAHELRLRSVIHKRLPLAYLAADAGEQRQLELDRWRQRCLDDVFARDGLEDHAHYSFEDSGDARLQVLFEHMWLSRMWTFQELILSRNPLLLFGNSIILWEELVNAILVTPQKVDTKTHWQTLIQLWLDFPRHRHMEQALSHPEERDAAVENGQAVVTDLYTFRSLIEFSPEKNISTPWQHILLRYGRKGAKLCLWNFGRWLVLMVLLLVNPILLGYFVTNSGSGRFLHLGIIFLLFWVGSLFPIARLAIINARRMSFWQLLHGMKRPEPRRRKLSSNSTNTIVISAIWTTLRMRRCSDDHDMVYALAAILEAYGMVMPPLEYSQSIKTSYQAFFQCILSLEPRAIQMIVDASVEDPSKMAWSSWLPDWRMPEKNNWLFNEHDAKHTWIQDFPQYCQSPAVIGDRLSVTGKEVDKIVECFHFTAVNLDDQQLVLANLRVLLRFMQSVHNRAAYGMDLYYRGAILAVLKGLLMQPVETTVRESIPDVLNGPSARMLVLDEIIAPFNFEAYRKDFYDFKRLNGLTHSFWERNDPITQYDPNMDMQELIREVQNDGAAVGFMLRMANKLAEQKRCVFVLSSGAVGSGPHFSAAGDEVLVVPGVSKHLVGRKKERQGTYRFIGPGLVHSIVARDTLVGGQYKDFVFE